MQCTQELHKSYHLQLWVLNVRIMQNINLPSYHQLNIPVDLPTIIIETEQLVPEDQVIKCLFMYWLYLAMLILSFMILDVTLDVKLKIESLSGLTDLVVSITNTRGGLRTFPLLFAKPCPPDWGHFWHLHPTHLRLPGQKESGEGASGSQSHPGGRVGAHPAEVREAGGLDTHTWNYKEY